MHEAFVPNLFERLTNSNSHGSGVGAGETYLNKEKNYKNSVIRNISWLLNSASLESEIDFIGAEHVKNSLINFGVRPFMGKAATTLKVDAMCDEIRNKILLFEPRVKSDSLEVSIRSEEAEINQFRLFLLIITAEILNYPKNIDLIFESKINFDDSKIYISAE